MQYSFYVTIKLVIDSFPLLQVDCMWNCDNNCEVKVDFDNMVHFINGELIVNFVDFDFGVNWYSEAPVKTGHTNREWQELPDPVKSPSASK